MQQKYRVPLIEEISHLRSAPETFEAFRQRPFAFFLDSSMDCQNLGRYSFMGSDPFLVMKSQGGENTLSYPDREERMNGNPFDVVAELLQVYSTEQASVPVPFVGGAVGYFSYDLCQFVERLPSAAFDDLQLPEVYLAFYDRVVVFDHLDSKVYVVSTGFPELEEDKRQARALARLEKLKESLRVPPLFVDPCPAGTLPREKEPFQSVPVTSRLNFTREEYVKAVQAVRAYIAAGDVFQVNLAQRFETDLTMSPYELYSHLRQINPAPFAAYLDFDEVKVISASPERFLKVAGDLVETRPMKGTRPRGISPAEDEALAAELSQSTKDQAENVMIVDLERNDLGKVCSFGSVRVRELFALERYATVFQLTSTVEGRLLPGKTRIDLLKGCFPGGSITGAPKVRAMEIIDELEPTKRSVYTGSIGYLSFTGEMDLNIAIRTIVVKDNKAYFQVGGGITYDSEPEAEYQETLDKAKALLESLGLSPCPESVVVEHIRMQS